MVIIILITTKGSIRLLDVWPDFLACKSKYKMNPNRAKIAPDAPTERALVKIPEKSETNNPETK